jgi:hypothetical protein
VDFPLSVLSAGPLASVGGTGQDEELQRELVGAHLADICGCLLALQPSVHC